MPRSSLKRDGPIKVYSNDNWVPHVWKYLSDQVRKYFHHNPKTLEILEAGCGQGWRLNLEGMDVRVTGVDISKEALEVRKYKEDDLDKIIVGDLRTVKLNYNQYNLINCTYVLEHIDGAEQVLDNFFKWLKPMGLLILMIPDRNTVLGFMVRSSPAWLRFLGHKYIKKNPNTGKPGHGPFPVYYDMVVSRKGIRNYCETHGHQVILEYGLKSGVYLSFGIFSSLLKIIINLIKIVSLGRLTSDYMDLVYIIKKSKSK